MADSFGNILDANNVRSNFTKKVVKMILKEGFFCLLFLVFRGTSTLNLLFDNLE